MRHTRLFARTFLFVLTALAFSAAAPAQEYQSWKYLNPKPQANLLRKMRMIDTTTWVAVGANGTFMRTTNAGVDWYFHHQAGKFSNAAQAIGQNYDVWFFNATTGIVAGDRGYIGRTTNGGVTFDSVANGLIPVAQRGQSIWFADQNTGFVGAGSGSGSGGTIVKTTNGGMTWSSVYTTTATAVQALAGTDSLNVYAVLANGAVAKTTNGGQSWNESAPSTVGSFMYTAAFVNANTGFAAGSGGLISKTTNAGATWNALTPPQTNWSYFHIKIVSAAEIYLVGDPGLLWKSTDLGATWGSTPIVVSGPASTFIWYSIDKQGSLLTMSGDFGVVAKSTDGGASWSSSHVNFGSQLMFDIQQVPGTQTLIAAGRQSTPTSGQILRSTNRGATWTRIDLGTATDLNAISMVDGQTGYVCGTNSVVYKTTNGGQSWTQTTSPSTTNYTLQAMEFVDASIGWIVVNLGTVPGGNIFKTTDGGTTWGQQTIGTTDQIVSLDMVDATTGYLTLNSSSRPIYKTTNGGTTWTSVTIPFTGQIRDVRALDANNVYIGASSGTGTNRIGKSTDGGATWTQIALPIAVDVNSVDFKDVNTGYVTGNSTTVVCRTTDAGTTWSFENVHLPTLVKVYVTPGDTAFALGTYGTILRRVPSTPGPTLAEQFKDHRTATMLTSVTNEGNFGSLNSFVGTGPGNGFQFNPIGTQRLYEGALIIATDSLHVSDAARNNANPEVFDADFKFAALIDSTQAGPILLRSTAYNDSLAEAPLYVRVNQTTVSVDTVGQSGILHVQLDVTNTAGTALTGMTVGGFFDWDVNSAGTDRGSVVVDSTNQIPGVNGGNPFPIEVLELHQAVSTNSWMGIVPLSANRFKARRIARSTTEVYPPRMTNADKWTYVNFNRSTNPNGDGGVNADHAQLFGLPSFNLAPAATQRVGFAMVGGTSLAELVQAARAAQRNWVQRLGNTLVVIPTGVRDDLAGIPESYDLSQNYPNPFNPSTVIRYALPEASQVTMRVYNLLGQEVAMLVNDVREAGYHEVVWNSRNNAGVTLATGVYFYRIEAKTLDGANAFTSLKKMLLVK